MNVCYKIKNAWYNLLTRFQRFKRGYAYGDIFNMNLWFIEVVQPMLIHLRNYGLGFPMEFNNRAEWCAVLDEMINCLHLMDEDNVYAFLGFYDAKKYKDITVDDCKQVNEIMTNNKNRFFELFSRYFYNLWD